MIDVWFVLLLTKGIIVNIFKKVVKYVVVFHILFFVAVTAVGLLYPPTEAEKAERIVQQEQRDAENRIRIEQQKKRDLEDQAERQRFANRVKFYESDIFFNTDTEPYKDIIIAGVNMLWRDNPNCGVLNPGSVGLSGNRGTSSNPAFFVYCGEHSIGGSSGPFDVEYFTKEEVVRSLSRLTQ